MIENGCEKQVSSFLHDIGEPVNALGILSRIEDRSVSRTPNEVHAPSQSGFMHSEKLKVAGISDIATNGAGEKRTIIESMIGDGFVLTAGTVDRSTSSINPSGNAAVSSLPRQQVFQKSFRFVRRNKVIGEVVNIAKPTSEDEIVMPESIGLKSDFSLPFSNLKHLLSIAFISCLVPQGLGFRRPYRLAKSNDLSLAKGNSLPTNRTNPHEYYIYGNHL